MSRNDHWTGSIALTIFVLISGCGTLVGNPKRPQEESATVPQVVSIPSIDFVLPGSITELGGEEEEDSSSLNLAPTIRRFAASERKSFSLLHAFADRSDRIVKSVNQMIDFLQSEKIQSTGKFSGRGAEKKISGFIEPVEDETYDFQAVICYDGLPVFHFKFDELGTQAVAVKDFSKTPVGEKLKSNFLSKVEFVKGASDLKVSVSTQGSFPQSASKLLRYDGPNLIERITYTRSENGAFGVTGVNDWFSGSAQMTGFEGDGYIVGQVAADGTGESVGYRKASLIACRGGFDENAADLFAALPQRGDAGWCLAQAVGSSTQYSATEKLSALKRLEKIGVTKKGALETVGFQSDLTCVPK